MKIAFSFLGGKHWIAGVTILESILAALHSLGAERPRIALVVHPGKDEAEYESLKPLVDEILHMPPPAPPAKNGGAAKLSSSSSSTSRSAARGAQQTASSSQRAVRFLKRVLGRFTPNAPSSADACGGDSFSATGAELNEKLKSGETPASSAAANADAGMSDLERFLLAHGVDAFFTKNECQPFTRIPLIGWIPDFQQEHLPEMFSEDEMAKRRAYFQKVAECCTRVVLTSRTVLSDYMHYLPEFAGKGRVMPFVTLVPSECLQSDPSWIVGEYQLPERFIYLPNQFFKHKNHQTVIEALRKAVEQNRDVCVVCTGNTQDHRHPHYFAEIEKQIESAGLRQNFRILGLIPYPHVFALMRQSLAVLQPSKFEGHPLSLAESKSMGKRIILSDIPVHRELAPDWAWFFAPDDEAALGALMLRLFSESMPGPDSELERRMQAENPSRVRHFAQTFIGIIEEARAREAVCST
ncbi:MAG TPA: glycosyltransferase [Candidatus Obscuribacterales bacterium]